MTDLGMPIRLTDAHIDDVAAGQQTALGTSLLAAQAQLTNGVNPTSGPLTGPVLGPPQPDPKPVQYENWWR